MQVKLKSITVSSVSLLLLVASVWAASIIPKELDALSGPNGNSVIAGGDSQRVSLPIGIDSTHDLDEAADTIIIPYAIRPNMYRRPWYDAFRGERTYW